MALKIKTKLVEMPALNGSEEYNESVMERINKVIKFHLEEGYEIINMNSVGYHFMKSKDDSNVSSGWGLLITFKRDE